MNEEDKELEPFYGMDVTAELCGTTHWGLVKFLQKYCTEFIPHYFFDGTTEARQRIFYRSEVISLRKKMIVNAGEFRMSRHDSARQVSDGGERIYSKRKKFKEIEKPPAHFLLS